MVKGGLLGEYQGINLPGVDLDIPTFTDKDRYDLEAGLEMGVDWVAMSFVRSGKGRQRSARTDAKSAAIRCR